MALTTRCPQCHAVFRVVADQLKLRGGLVRCGQCATVFDAISALSYLEDAQLKQALAPRAPSAPASRPAAPPSAPSPVPASAAPAEFTAAARQTPIAPLMLSAAPVVARAEPVDWARLRRAAADSPLLLGGDHGTAVGAESTTGTAGDAEAANSAVADRVASLPPAETSASETLPALPADLPEIADADGERPMRGASFLPPAASEQGQALEAADAIGAPLLDEALEAGDSLEASTAVTAAGDSASEPAAALAASSEELGRAGAAASGLPHASSPSDAAESQAGAEANDSEAGRLDAAHEQELAGLDTEPGTPSAEAAIRELATEASAGDIAIDRATAEEDAGDLASHDTATGASGRDGALSSPDAAPAPAEVGFLNSVAQARARRRAWLWGIAATLTAVILAWQLALALRAEILMRWPQAYPLLVRLCEPLGCQVEWPMQPALLAVLASDLQAVPGTPALELDVTVRNRAPYPQALPAIELTLMDTRGQAIVRRVFTPAEYGAPPQGSLAPGADLAARVLFEVKGPAPAGFLVYPFYP